MVPPIKVSLAPETCVPVAAVPLHHSWDLAEYLACRRTKVHYRYGSMHCEVSFPNLDGPAAQRILDDWAASSIAQSQRKGATAWRSDREAAGMMTPALYSARARGWRPSYADDTGRELQGEPWQEPSG